MYDIIQGIIGHTWTTSSSDQQYIYYACTAVICLLIVVFTDLVFRLFRQFWRG